MLHLAASVMLVGTAALLLLAGRSDRRTALGWQAAMTGWSAWLVVLAVVGGIGALAHQTAVVAGWARAALDPGVVASVLVETQSGRIWLARHAVLALVGVFVVLAPRALARSDWLAVRGEAVLLSALALCLLALVGHAVAVTPDPGSGLGATAAVLVDALHVLATGVWLGGLLPLATLLIRASRADGADGRPYAVLAARRFSRSALACVVVLIATGVVNAVVQVGSVPALVGTAYGRLLLLKLGLLVPVLAIAGLNRRLIPRLAGEGDTVGRPAMRDLGRFIGFEVALALGLLAVVALMGVTPPARHAQPTWPFSFRLTLDAVQDVPDLRARALIGSQVMVLGVVALLCAALLRPRRLTVGVGATALLAFGAGLALPPLAVDAYPTTYRRPAVPYQVASVAEGAALFQAHCAACHGRTGAGDGPARPTLSRPPADLRAAHTAQHTVGDIFWWVSAGIPAAQMPGFAGGLDAEQRWDLVNFVRALGAGAAASRLGGAPSPAALVAPDFTFAVGPTPPRALKEYRGRRIVLLVLYSLPGSRERLAELARDYDALVLRGAEVIAVPRDAGADAIRRLGDDPRVLFPVVTDGARDIVAVYDLFAPGPHAELLIDRQGYVRARWLKAGDRDQVVAGVDRLNQEPVALPPAAEHAH